jgi:hypothetical protein
MIDKSIFVDAVKAERNQAEAEHHQNQPAEDGNRRLEYKRTYANSQKNQPGRLASSLFLNPCGSDCIGVKLVKHYEKRD